jgi:hypothetical protein
MSGCWCARACRVLAAIFFRSAMPRVALSARWCSAPVLLFAALLTALPAQALTYNFPGPTLPTGCSATPQVSGSYTCGALTLAAGDKVTISGPTTIHVVGALVAGADVTINADGASSNLTINVDDAIGLGASIIINGSITSGAGINAGADSIIGGNISAPNGAVTLGASVKIGGNITTGIGAVLIGAFSTIKGAVVSTVAGAVTLGEQVNVGGDISTVTGAILIGASSKITGSLIAQLTGAVTLGASSTVAGNISTREGAVLVGAFSSISGAISSSFVGAIGLGEQVIVGGNISTMTGGIDVGASSTLSGSLDISGAGAISLGATLHVVGTVSTSTGAITIGAFSLADSQIFTRGAGAITMGNLAIVAGVCCQATNDAICVANNTTLPMPPVCQAGGVSSKPESFACLAQGSNSPWSASARQALYTKLTGVTFALDIAALSKSMNLETNYVKAPTVAKYARVELFDDTAPAASCAAYGGALATQTATFFESSAGRTLSGNFNLGGAYRKVLCRVSECSDAACAGFTGVQSCSEDRFSVRPAALVMTQNTPTKNAGSTFTLQATAVRADASTVANYTGMPTLNVEQITGTPAFSAAALAPQALPAATAGVSSDSFTYDEVGSFTLPATSPGSYGVFDSNYTNIDSGNIAGSIDCIAGSASNTADGSGRYGCLIGQFSALTVGRFYPDHFDIAPTFVPACSSGDFTYMAQPFDFSYIVTARSLARLSPAPPGNRALALYSGGQLNLVVADGATDLTARLSPAVPQASSWSLGSHALMPASYQFKRPTATTAHATWGPYDALDIGVAIDDPDGRGYLAQTPAFVWTSPAACIASGSTECRNYASLSAGAKTRMRLGRLKLDNVYGSALLPLSVPLAAQYWSGSGSGWASNTQDSCTVLPISSISMGNYSKQLNACETRLTPVGNVVMDAGKLPGLRLSSPGAPNAGSVDLAINVGAAAVGNNCVSPDGSVSAATAADMPWFGVRQGARATFGIYKSPIIYQREIY